jgi:hypothetical protein
MTKLFLSNEAKMAGAEGQKEAAEIITSSVSLLDRAHRELVDKGRRFGSEVAETDEQKMAREKAERDMVSELATKIAAQEAIQHKKQGDDEASVKSIGTSTCIAGVW